MYKEVDMLSVFPVVGDRDLCTRGPEFQTLLVIATFFFLFWSFK